MVTCKSNAFGKTVDRMSINNIEAVKIKVKKQFRYTVTLFSIIEIAKNIITGYF